MIRCEVSLDGGNNWRLADIERHEKPTPYGKHWCWVFWSIKVPTVDLLRSTEIRVRAVDSSNNMMPEKYGPAHTLVHCSDLMQVLKRTNQHLPGYHLCSRCMKAFTC